MKTKRRMATADALAAEIATPPRSQIVLGEPRRGRPQIVRDDSSSAPAGSAGTSSTAIDWESFLPARASTGAWRIGQRAKRLIDVVGAGGGMIVLTPLLLTLALLVRATSRGPVFYRCRYIGERGRSFVGYKLRSMVANADDLKASMVHLNHMKGPAFKIRNDPRVTPLGRLLRKFSLDELPQLWNVLKGDMSLVGPRPPLPEEFSRFADWHKRKLAVRPGITCLWQINGRSEICDFDEWARLDLQYIENWSLRTDFKILLETIPAVFHGHGAY
jgi:lipopolysaccharide/colanic/teichoic acid biosynthesis glycosyltransferase